MREVLPRQLWIGTARDGRESSVLDNAEIGAMIDLAVEELPVQPCREVAYCRFPLIDGSGNSPGLISAAIATAAALIRHRVRTLVCCSAGMSRSPAIVAAALALVHGEALDECLRRLAAHGAHDISPALWADVTSTYRQMD